jgi:hypothetical protein
MLGILYHGNKNRSKLSEFGSEPFRGTENSRNSVPKRSAEEIKEQLLLFLFFKITYNRFTISVLL